MNEDEQKTGGTTPPEGKGEKKGLSGWAVFLALLGAGAIPCPECGAPLAGHIWPLAALLLAAQFISRRGRRNRPEPDRKEPLPDTAEDRRRARGGE
ncbi:MAG: hypothetical protein ACK2UB_07840 [Anaerolineales bacterium]